QRIGGRFNEPCDARQGLKTEKGGERGDRVNHVTKGTHLYDENIHALAEPPWLARTPHPKVRTRCDNATEWPLCATSDFSGEHPRTQGSRGGPWRWPAARFRGHLSRARCPGSIHRNAGV